VSLALSLEDEVLLAAAHPMPSARRAARLVRLLERPVDWSAVIPRADRHGVAALVYENLRALPVAPVPTDVWETLSARARTCVASNLRLRYELDRLLAAFSRAGVPVMPLKGPVLADQLYPAPLLRHSSDLDVLVQPHDRAVAQRVVEGLGYVRRPDPEQGAEYHTIFTANGVDVELHVDVGERHVSRLDVHALWAAARRSSWDGRPIWSMAVADQLLYLAFHAVKDGLASVRALVDIALLVERHGASLVWPELLARVRAVHLAPVVYLALRESRVLLDVPVPQDFLDAIRPRSAAWALADRLFRWRGGVLDVPDDLLVGPAMAALMFLWEETWPARLRHLRRNCVPSAPLRGRWLSGPAPVSWMTWYPLWIAHAVRCVARQVAARPRASMTRWS
jgi:hypothetical protein